MGSSEVTEKSDKGQKIIEAALALFSEKGFDGASTADIARKAGVAEGTIFKYFKNKKELLIKAVSPFALRYAAPYILRPVKNILEDDTSPARDVLAAIMKERVALVEENWPQVRILMQEALKVPELREAVISTLAKEARSMLEGFLSKRMETGELRKMDPFIAARAFMGLLGSYVASKHAFKDESSKWNEESHIDTMLDLFMGGLASKD